MARDPYIIFQIFTEILIKELTKRSKKLTFYCFCVTFQVFGHVKNLLKLINALKMKNLFILTEQITKHMFVYTLPRGQHRN